MEDVGEDSETSNQQSNDGTVDAALGELADNIGPNFCFGGEEYYNPNRETQSGRTVVSELAIPIPDSERQKPVIIGRSGWSPLKVPVPMFKVDTGNYVPTIVSIGPFHRNGPNLRDMQTQKQWFLDHLIQNQTGQPNDFEESLKNAMRELEKETRNFYAYDFQTIKPDEFRKMMLLDGVFIVELLRLYKENRETEPIFETRWMHTNVSRDLLLLENQLPMCVLKKIFELTTLQGEATLNTLALGFFEPLRPARDKFEKETLDKHANGEYKHLLALFHSTLISGDNKHRQQPAKSETEKTHDLRLPGKGWVRNAKTLSYAGIKFREKSGSILDIQLKGKICKTLEISTMVIDHSTSLVLRNMIAYEQNNRNVAPYFCFLALFLDSIVDTAEDVKILCDARIIKHAMGRDEEVANLFNKLTKELVFDINDKYFYTAKQTIEKINRHCRRHDIRVRIRRLLKYLTRLNLNGLLDLFSSTLIIIYFLKDVTSNDNS